MEQKRAARWLPFVHLNAEHGALFRGFALFLRFALLLLEHILMLPAAARFGFLGGAGGRDALPVAELLREPLLVVDVRRRAVVARQLVVVIHLDRVERAELCAEAAVHADVDVDVELFRLWDGAAGFRVVGADDPDALRRADFRADAAACAPVVTGALWMIVVLDHQERDEAEALGRGD